MRDGVKIMACLGLISGAPAQTGPDPTDSAVTGLPVDGYYAGQTQCARGPLTIQLFVEDRTNGHVRIYPPGNGAKYPVRLVKKDLTHFSIEPAGGLEATGYVIRKYGLATHRFAVVNVGSDVVATPDDPSCAPMAIRRTANYQIDPRSFDWLSKATLSTIASPKRGRSCPSGNYVRGDLPGEVDCVGGWVTK